MNRKLFVGGLAWATNEESLRRAFSEFGTVEEVKVITDRDTGRSKGFGFITMGTSEEAEAAVNALQDTKLDGRSLNVSEAENKNGGGGGREPRESRERHTPRFDKSEPEIIRRTARDGGLGGQRTPRKR